MTKYDTEPKTNPLLQMDNDCFFVFFIGLVS